MSETQLQIVISVLNNAAGQLAEVGDQLSGLGEQASTTAGEMSASMAEAATAVEGSFTAAESAAIAAAEGSLTPWQEAAQGVEDAFATIETPISEVVASLASVNEAAAAQVSAAWAQQGQAMENDLAAAMGSMEGDVTTASDEMVTKVASASGSMHGYFAAMMAGYAMVRAGEAGLGAVGSMVTAATGNPTQIASLTDQINQQKASIAENQAALQKWMGTTAEVDAAHEKARANIATEQTAIEKLTLQLQPLIAAHQASAQEVAAYDAATEKLNSDWQASEGTLGATLLPLLTQLATVLDKLVTDVTNFAEANPHLTETILIFTAGASALLVVIGYIAIAVGFWALMNTAVMATLLPIIGPILLLGILVAALAAIFIANWGAIKSETEYLAQQLMLLLGGAWDWIRSETGQLISDFKSAWNALATWWNDFWNGIYTTIENIWTKIESIISAITSAISKVTGPVAAIAGAVGSTVSGAIGGMVGAVTHVQDAIITPGGGIIQTDPADYLIATKTPGALAGGGAGGGSINVYIQGGTYLDQNGATVIATALAQQIGRQIKLTNFF